MLVVIVARGMICRGSPGTFLFRATAYCILPTALYLLREQLVELAHQAAEIFERRID